MPWARLDDNRHDHPKILALGDDIYALAAVGLLDHAITWASRHRRKAVVVGFVPWAFWRTRGGKHWKRLTDLLQAGSLVDADTGDGGLVIHNFADYGPKRDPDEAAESGRRGAAARAAAGGYSHSNSHTDSHSNSHEIAVANNGSRAGAPASAPASSRPVPSRPAVGSLEQSPAGKEPRDPETADLSDLQKQTTTQLANSLTTLRPGIDRPQIEAQATRLIRAGKPWPRIAIALIACVLDPDTRFAARVHMADGYWWRDNDRRTQAALTKWVAAGHRNPTEALVR